MTVGDEAARATDNEAKINVESGDSRACPLPSGRTMIMQARVGGTSGRPITGRKASITWVDRCGKYRRKAPESHGLFEPRIKPLRNRREETKIKMRSQRKLKKKLAASEIHSV